MKVLFSTRAVDNFLMLAMALIIYLTLVPDMVTS